jgi:hypothetical protein
MQRQVVLVQELSRQAFDFIGADIRLFGQSLGPRTVRPNQEWNDFVFNGACQQAGRSFGRSARFSRWGWFSPIVVV